MSPERSRRLLDLLAPTAAVMAEAGWLATWYAAAALLFDGPPLRLGLWAFALAAGAGLAVARSRRVTGPAEDGALLLLVAAAVVLAQLADPAARSAVVAGDWSQLIALTPGPLLVALAVWRGARHRDPGEELRVTSNLLTWGVPLLVVPWVAGWQLEPVLRPGFVGAALPASLVFVAAGFFGIGIARLEALGADSGVDWRTNRSWLGLLGAVVAGLAIVGLPAALLLGAPVAALLAAALGPVQLVLDAFVWIVGLIVGPLLGWLQQLPPNESAGAPVVASPPDWGEGIDQTGSVPLWLILPFLVPLVVGLVVLLVRFLRRPRSAARRAGELPPVAEERSVVLPDAALHLPGRPRWRLGRRPHPTSASQAYLALLADLERTPDAGRRPTETPIAHARRLREAGAAGTGLALLAADYGLERYAGRELSERETRRALARWRAIARAVGRRPQARPQPAASGQDA